MDERLVIIINAIISIVVAWITGWISAKNSYNKEIKQSVYEKREEVYTSFFEILLGLERNPYLVFNRKDFLIPFQEIKIRLNMYASQSVIDIIEPFYDTVLTIFNAYESLFLSEEALRNIDNRIQYEEVTELDIEREEENYTDTHVIDKEEVHKVLVSVTKQIRNELRTNK